MKLLVRCCLSHRNQKERQYFKHALLRNASYHIDFSLQSWACFISSSTSSCLDREGNGSPLQYSRLEKPRDGGAWWAAVHGVTKSRTRLRDFTFTFFTLQYGSGFCCISQFIIPSPSPAVSTEFWSHHWFVTSVGLSDFIYKLRLLRETLL